MDETTTIIVLSLAELSLISSGLAVFFYFRSKKTNIKGGKKSGTKPLPPFSDQSAIHAFFHNQIKKLQKLPNDDLGDAKMAIDARIKILKNESLLLSNNDIDYGQQLKFYQTIVAATTTNTQMAGAEQSMPEQATSDQQDDLPEATTDATAEATLTELDELEMPTAADSEETTETIDSEISLSSSKENGEKNIELGNDHAETDGDNPSTDDNLSESSDEYDLEVTDADDTFELVDEEAFEPEDEMEFALETEDEFEFVAEQGYEEYIETETIEEDFAGEEGVEAESVEAESTAGESVVEAGFEEESGKIESDEIESTEIENTEIESIEVDSFEVESNDDDNFVEATIEEDSSAEEEIPVLQDSIELDAPLITGELKNESAEIGKIRNIVNNLHTTIEELKQFSDEQALEDDADEYLAEKLQEIEVSNARLNLCTENLEKDNARLLELVNQKDEELLENDKTASEADSPDANSIDAMPEKDRKATIELLEVEVSSLEKRLDDKTNRLDNLQTLETDLSHVEEGDNGKMFNQLMKEIDNLTEMLTTKSQDLSKLRVYAINPEEQPEPQKKTGT